MATPKIFLKSRLYCILFSVCFGQHCIIGWVTSASTIDCRCFSYFKSIIYYIEKDLTSILSNFWKHEKNHPLIKSCLTYSFLDIAKIHNFSLQSHFFLRSRGLIFPPMKYLGYFYAKINWYWILMLVLINFDWKYVP